MVIFSERHQELMILKPILWRVLRYFGPGLPRPAMRYTLKNEHSPPFYIAIYIGQVLKIYVKFQYIVVPDSNRYWILVSGYWI